MLPVRLKLGWHLAPAVLITAVVLLAAASATRASELDIRIDEPYVDETFAAVTGGVYFARQSINGRKSVFFRDKAGRETRVFSASGPRVASPVLRLHASDELVVAQIDFIEPGIDGYPGVLHKSTLAVGRPGERMRRIDACGVESIAVEGAEVATAGRCRGRRDRIRVYALRRGALSLRAEIVVPREARDRRRAERWNWSSPELSVNDRFVSLIGENGVSVWNWRAGRHIRTVASSQRIWSATLTGGDSVAVVPYRYVKSLNLDNTRTREVLVFDSGERRPRVVKLPLLDLTPFHGIESGIEPEVLFTRSTGRRDGSAQVYSLNPATGVTTLVAEMPRRGELTPGDPARRILWQVDGCWWTDIRSKQAMDPVEPMTSDCPGDIVEGSLILSGRVLSFDFVCPLGCQEAYLKFGPGGESVHYFSSPPGRKVHLRQRLTVDNAATLRSLPGGQVPVDYSENLTARIETKTLTVR